MGSAVGAVMSSPRYLAGSGSPLGMLQRLPQATSMSCFEPLDGWCQAWHEVDGTACHDSCCCSSLALGPAVRPLVPSPCYLAGSGSPLGMLERLPRATSMSCHEPLDEWFRAWHETDVTD